MTPVLAFLLLAATLWGLVLARRASVLLAALATIVVGYALGHSFWNLHLGPLPITLDRVMLAGLMGLVAWRWHTGKLTPARIGGAEWALAATLVWLTLSALVSRPGADVHLPSSPMWRLLFSFWAPALLLFAVRAAKESSRNALLFLAGLALLGGYLAVTAIAETAGAWAFVFPRYIADPELGLHFGRARGPALNSVSLGVYLTVCLWAAWLLIPRAPKPAKVALALLVPLMALSVLLTYTRSVWIGALVSGVVVLLWHTPKDYRKAALLSMLGVGVIVGPIAMASLVAFKREDSGYASKHSVEQRGAFAYVSWKMFCDHPLTGVGFGRFYDQKLPYLSDRSQKFELESLRPLHHHNTLLSLLTETGMIGLLAYLGLLGGLLRASWRLANSPSADDAARRIGILSVATLTAYLPSAVFHDLSLVHTDQWLVLMIAGAALSFERRLGLKDLPETSRRRTFTGVPSSIATANS
ncbi:MAG: O-antigen ligase family protein [Planctomycetales bacterium]|nr:O-antigen ligase family protein [Planctomycetales bacterium]